MPKALPPSIVLASVLSLVNIVIICLPGVYFARQGLVSQDMRRSLGHMSFNFLLPTLTFVNIAPQVDAQELKLWWPVAANIIVSCLVSLATGWASSRLPWTKPEHRKLVIAASAFGNTNSAMLMLVSAVCSQHSLPFFASLGGYCVKNGFAYVAIGLAAYSALTFPVVVQLIKPKKPQSLPQVPSPKDIESNPGTQVASCYAHDLIDDAEGHAPLHSAKTQRQHEAGRRSTALASSVSAPVWRASAFERMSFNAQQGALGMAWPEDGPREAHAFDRLQSFNAQEAMLAASASAHTEKLASAPGVEASMKEVQTGVNGSRDDLLIRGKACSLGFVGQRIVPHLRRLRDSRACKICQTLLGWANKVMPPLTVASLSGLVVGCVPFFKNLMIPASNAPLGFVMTALDTISGAFVYLISFILGAVLQKGPGDGTRLVGWGSIMMTVLNRFLIMPVLGCFYIFGTHKLGWWRPPNSLFTFIMLMTNATPTGNQVQAVCAMYHSCETECGAILFWQYMASIVCIPVWMVIFLTLMYQFDHI